MRARLLLIVPILFASTASSVLAQNWMDKLKGAVDTITTPGTSSSAGSSLSGLSTEDIAAGLREALKVGTERVVERVGAVDGYNADPDIHIPLPPTLANVQSTLRKFGLSALADDVELRLNRAAESAAPKAKELIWKAITEMTLDDAKGIYNGPEDAATQYFRRVATPDLEASVRPVVNNSLAEVGAISAYDQLIGQYKTLPFVPDVKTSLSDHAVDLTLDGLFFYLAKEEAAIRQNPAERTTEILTRVFGK